MERVKVSIEVNDYFLEGVGEKNNSILKVKAKEEEISFDLEKLLFKRENNEIKMILDFKNKELKYKIPESEKEFYNKIKLISLTNKDKEYNIMYQMGENKFNLKINYKKL